MLYCSIEDAWGPLPVNEQIKKYKGEGLEHFQNIIKKKVSRKLRKKKKPSKKFLRKKSLRERFEDTEESCDSEEYYDSDHFGEESNFQEKQYLEDEEKQYLEDEEEQYTESEPNYTEEETENTTIINLKKKVNKLIKENGNLKDKIKKLRKDKPLVLNDFINDFLTDKNREIIMMSLIGLMIIVIFHLLVRSSK